MDKKSYIIKKYNINKNIKDNHLGYYYTTYPELCCKYDLKPIDGNIKPYEFNKAIKFLDNYYANIKSSYYKDLLNETEKYGNDINKYPSEIADRIIFEYVKFRKNTYCLTLWPYIDHINVDDLTKFLGEYGNVYYVKQIKLNDNAALNLIHQLYSDTKRFPTVNKLKEKLEYLGWKKGDSKNIRVVFFENTSKEVISGSQAQLKTKIRNYLLQFVNNKNLRGDDLVHINDHFYQTVEYAKIFLHKKTLSFLKKQNIERYMSTDFDNCRLYSNTIKKWLIENVELIDYDRFLFFGSLILYVYGLRNCRDIDGLVYGNNNTKTVNLINKTAEFFYNNNTKFFFGSLGIMNTQYWKDEWDVKDVKWLEMMGINHKDEMIFDPNNHFYFNGIKILTIKNEVFRKVIRLKPQDFADIIQMINVLKIKINLPKINMDNAFINDVRKTLNEKYRLNNYEIDNLLKLYR